VYCLVIKLANKTISLKPQRFFLQTPKQAGKKRGEAKV